MNLRKSQSLLLTGILCILLSFFGAIPAVYAYGTAPQSNQNAPNDNTNAAEQAFNEKVEKFAGSQARLGDELSQLPGPKVDFNTLARTGITWAASLAASVALYLLVWNAFKAISGTEESHNALKRVLIQIIVGLSVILFAYQLVAWIMGILWASSSI